MNPEFSLLAAVIDAGHQEWPPITADIMLHAPDSFDDLRAGTVAVQVRALRAAREPVALEIVARKCRSLLPWILTELSSPMGLDVAEYYAPDLWSRYVARRGRALAEETGRALENHPEQAAAILAGAREALAFISLRAGGLADTLAKNLYHPHARPPEPEPRYALRGIPICTPDNLTAISAHAKAGKSAALGAMLASTFAQAGADCLGFTSQNPQGRAVLHLDTEQAPFDHWDAGQRMCRRAGVAAPPPWLRSYCLTGFSPPEIREAIRLLMEQAAKKFGGLHSVILDGTADGVNDVNDAADTGVWVTELHGLAIRFHCPILNVIHINPGSDFKTRGHLGSQLERKAETNLRLEKDENGVSVIWADKNRRAPIPKKTAPRFVWNPECGMHTAIKSLRDEKTDLRRHDSARLAQDLFAGHESMNYAELKTTITELLMVSAPTAERKIAELVKLGFIKKSAAGVYQLTTYIPSPSTIKPPSNDPHDGATITPSPPYIEGGVGDGSDGEGNEGKPLQKTAG